MRFLSWWLLLDWNFFGRVFGLLNLLFFIFAFGLCLQSILKYISKSSGWARSLAVVPWYILDGCITICAIQDLCLLWHMTHRRHTTLAMTAMHEVIELLTNFVGWNVVVVVMQYVRSIMWKGVSSCALLIGSHSGKPSKGRGVESLCPALCNTFSS